MKKLSSIVINSIIMSLFLLPIIAFSESVDISSSTGTQNTQSNFDEDNETPDKFTDDNSEPLIDNIDFTNSEQFIANQSEMTRVSDSEINYSQRSYREQVFAAPRKGGDSTINYKAKNPREDPWASGTITIEIKEDININDVMYVDKENKNRLDELLKSLSIFNIKEIFDKHINKFYISSEIDLPEGIQAKDFIRGIGNDGHLKVDGIDFSIAESSWLEIPGNPNKVLLKISKNETVGFWTKIKEQLSRLGILKNIIKSIVKTISDWILGNAVYVSMDMILPINVDRLTANGASVDMTKNKCLTKGKLPPELDKSLDFIVGIHGLDNKQLFTEPLSIPTWNSYISPWNKKYADSNTTGQSDNLNIDRSTEVTNEKRVLSGEEPRDRVIILPYSDQNFKKESYVRVVNIFTRKTNNSYEVMQEVKETTPNRINETNQASNLYETTIILKNSALSPAKVTVKQTVTLSLEKSDLGNFNVFSNEPFNLTGTVEASDSKELIVDVSSTFKYKHSLVSGVSDKVYNYELNKNTINMSKKTEPFTIELLKGTPLKFPTEYFSLLDMEEIKTERDRLITVTVTDAEHELTVSELYEIVVISSDKEELRKVSMKKPKNQLSFGTVDVFNGQSVYNREKPFKIVVEDTLKDMKPWQITASLDKDTLETEDGDQFPGYLIYKDGEKEQFLGTESICVYQNKKRHGQTFMPVNWDKNEGILLKPAEDLSKVDRVSSKNYIGTVTFTLSNEPKIGAQ